MGNFNLDGFNNVLTKALSPYNPGMPEARMEVIEKLKALFDEIDKAMAEENGVYIDSADSTYRFDLVMRKMRKIVDSINPQGLDFSLSKASLFNDPLKSYFKKVEKLNDDFSFAVDEIDRLIKSFKLELTTLKITLSALQGKTSKLEGYNAELDGALNLVREKSKGIDKSDSEAILFIEKRIMEWAECERLNLSKSTVVTGQRILTVSMGIDNISKIIETLKATKAVTIELFENIAGLANEKYRQKMVFKYSAETYLADGNIKEAYQKVDSILPK